MTSKLHIRVTHCLDVHCMYALVTDIMPLIDGWGIDCDADKNNGPENISEAS